jgi:hypothetical protein
MSHASDVGAPVAFARARHWAARWVALWSEREPPTCLAAIRIGLALVVAYDLVTLAAHGAISWLWAPIEAGGVSSWSAGDAPLFYRLLPPTAGSATLLWGGLLLSAIGVGSGSRRKRR